MANLQQYGTDVVTLWNVSNPASCPQYQLAGISAKEWIDRSPPGTFVEFLGPGQTPDPARSGLNKIIIDPRVSWRNPLDHTR